MAGKKRGISNEAFGQMVGVSARAVDKAGPERVVRFPDGSIDAEASLAAWEERRQGPAGPGRGRGREPGGRVDWKDKKEREAYLKLKLERKQLQGKLVPVADVVEERAAVSALVRSRLDPIGKELAAALAAEIDPRRCGDMVDAAIRDALEALADEAQREAE